MSGPRHLGAFSFRPSVELTPCGLQDALLEAFLIMPAQLAHLLQLLPRIMSALVDSLQVRLPPCISPAATCRAVWCWPLACCSLLKLLYPTRSCYIPTQHM